jgi:chorismate synthase
MNTFGTFFRLTSFGESHGTALGGIIDGCPPGVEINMDFIREEMKRRRPGQSQITTQRHETDEVEFLSGLFEGKTTGAPIGFIVRNENQRSDDYDNLKDVFRPSHADYTYQMKYGVRDHRGGGRSSARETVSRCVAGAVAKLFLNNKGIDIQAYTSQIGDIRLEGAYTDYDLSLTETNPVRCPDPRKAADMEALIRQVKADGDTVGGIVSCVIKGVPVGLGEPVFDKLHAALGFAMLSINAAKGFDYGDGFDAPNFRGSVHNDTLLSASMPDLQSKDRLHDNYSVRGKWTNFSGGIQGGISNGEDIYFRVVFKAVATLLQEQTTIDVNGNPVVFKTHGRHDACVIPRAVPIVEAMAAITIMDYVLQSNIFKYELGF